MPKLSLNVSNTNSSFESFSASFQIWDYNLGFDNVIKMGYRIAGCIKRIQRENHVDVVQNEL